MKRKRKGTRRRGRAFRLWTHAEAHRAVPYLRSVMTSLREHLLEAVAHKRAASQLQTRPGKPDRDRLIALEDHGQGADRAEQRFEEAAAELWALDVYAVDAIRGEAQVPFVHEDQLAWYLFDLFDPRPLRFWRFQRDSEDTRRPVTPSQKGEKGVTWKV